MNRLMLFILCLVLGVVAQAQPKIGLTFSPSVSLNTVSFKSDLGDITNDGAGLRFKLGMEAEFDITDTYAFSTGLIYAPKRVGFTIVPDGEPASSETYKSQYLQIPLTLKLYTSEVVQDVKGFFQLGFLAEVKIFSEAQNDTYTLVEKGVLPRT
ncbi:MAG: PorT family protein [Cyclobacteriaceae bacterium]|jgi:hypothetical protein|nr:PorT family protein [Cyclobacteriaceae bacterium]